MINYKVRLLDTHDLKVKKALKNKDFKSRGFLNTLKKTWFLKADISFVSKVTGLSEKEIKKLKNKS